ncbi:MAG: NmrA family NAD(P)-binding protein [Deltaproteobacteria bacterium]|nr:NmrA family NAD(P)-binding protein [Deltaproteobacteria bacterium]
MFVIAGVTGHVGSATAKSLLAKGAKVKVIVRDAKKGAEWSKLGAEVAQGSITDTAFLTGALKGAEGFFTLLPPDFVSADLFAGQKATSDAIAAAVKASGIKHVVLLSSVGAHLSEKNGPIKGLNYLEGALKATGVTLTALRPGSFQENVHNSVGAAKATGQFYNLSLSADYAYPQIATQDIGAFAAEALLAKPAKSESVLILGPSYSPRQVAEKLGAALGKTLQIVDVPMANWAGALQQGGVPKPMADALAEMYVGFNTGIITGVGDRTVQGTTTIDEVIKHAIA